MSEGNVRDAIAGGAGPVKCKRCQGSEAVLIVRTEQLCRDCFIKYINTKVIKRMENFRVRNSTMDNPRLFLLPISFGVSSVALLHLLDGQLQGQINRMNRTGYGLLVAYVNMPSAAPIGDCLKELQGRYPRHTYSAVDLAENFDYPNGILDILGEPELLSAPNGLGHQAVNQDKLDHLLASLPSATSRTDILNILRTRLLVEIAKERGCEGILWGDSTTRLAEKTLAETAKGRGFALPWQLSDGVSPHGLVFKYPLRDLLKKELVTYASLVDPPLTPFIASGHVYPASNSKSATIDDLMTNYFESVEGNFPSIVANVVRTSSKLVASQPFSSGERCGICEMPIAKGAGGLHGWGGNQEDEANPSDSNLRTVKGLCYGCTRSTLGAAVLVRTGL
ncbi:MAG: cytoplasmic tRNA 2-thiolation protein 2 [Geoglossum umbratile]|nr:MAG: cytoplasmic tRNA 2-thiolation protein 2 [Geoglossum umbratile]